MLERIQVDILGLSTSPSAGGAYALILKEVTGARRLPIIIGAFEAQSIALELEGIKPPRPLTHDLIKNIIETMGAGIHDVYINELKDGTFYARISFDSQEIDSRPSDAIAIAVRFGAPIFVAESVMEEAGFVPEADDAEKTPTTTGVDAPEAPSADKPKLTKLEQLELDLKEAIAKEDYEKAARLRDDIKKQKTPKS
jgi:bifunctional DNase/RNase